MKTVYEVYFKFLNQYDDTQYDTGLYIDDNSTLTAITNCIEKEAVAKEELEYYCLNLVSNHCNGVMYSELDLFLKFLIEFGNRLLYNVKAIGLYQNGIFPYAYRNRRYDAMQFLRKDILYKQIKDELYQDGYYSKPKTYSS